MVIGSCTGAGEVPREEEDGAWLEVDEDIRLDAVRYREWKKGQVNWDLDARRVAYHIEGGRVSFQDVSLIFVPPEGGDSLTLRADAASYEIEVRRLRVEGNVTGEGSRGFRFRTESLEYDLDEKRVWTRDKVILEKDRLIVEGLGMEGSLIDQTFLLLSAVRTVLVPPRGAR